MRLHLLAVLPLLALAGTAASAQTTVSLGLRLGGNRATRAGDNPTFQSLSPRFGIPVVASALTQEYTRTGLFAAQVGAVLEVRFGKLSVQSAVLLSQKGADQRVSSRNTVPPGPNYNPNYPNQNGVGNSFTQSYHVVTRPNYLEIPINLVYTSKGDHGFQLFGGPYLAFGVGGQSVVETSYYGLLNTGAYYAGYSYYRSFMSYVDEYPGDNSTGLLQTTPYYLQNTDAYLARRFDAGLNAGVGYRRGPLQVQLGYGMGLLNQQPGKGFTLSEGPTPYYHRVAQLTATYFYSLSKPTVQ